MTPVVGWTAAAVVLGVSPSTLARRRKHFRDDTEVPWWPSADACRAWFGALIARKARPVAGRAARSAAFDPAALRRELTRP